MTDAPSPVGRPPGIAILSADELAEIGERMYGAQWQTALARDLKITDRSLRYLAAGDRPIHAGIARDLVAIIAKRGEQLAALAASIAAKVAEAG